MAEDIKEVQKEELPFHPCLTPRGMTWYNLEVLTPVQQKLMNDVKVDVARQDNQYLAKHPEIRAIIAVFLHAILREQPKLRSVVDFARDFFIDMQDVKQKVDEYMKERGEPIEREGASAMDVIIPSVSARSSVDIFDAYTEADVYTYTSYTTEEVSSPKEYEESDYNIQRLFQKASRVSAWSSQAKSFLRQKELDMLFSSQTTLGSAREGYYEDQDQTDFNDKYYALPVSPPPTLVDIQADETFTAQTLPDDQEQEPHDKISIHGEDFDDDKILKEIKMAQEIHESLSVVVDVYEDDENDDDKEYTYISPDDKKSLIQADIESIKEGTLNIDENEDNFEEQKKASVVLETLLNYENRKTMSEEGDE